MTGRASALRSQHHALSVKADCFGGAFADACAAIDAGVADLGGSIDHADCFNGADTDADFAAGALALVNFCRHFLFSFNLIYTPPEKLSGHFSATEQLKAVPVTSFWNNILLFFQKSTGKNIYWVYISHMLLKVDHLTIGFGSGKNYCEVVSDVSFSLEKGTVTALVGESGCGKSLTCLSLGGLLPPGATVKCGGIFFDNGDGEAVNLNTLPAAVRRKYNGGGIAYVFQEPASSLNPVFTVASQIEESLRRHSGLDKKGRNKRVIELLERVGIPAPSERAKAYPHELSGGMQQRVMIALALAGNPRLLVADEPTTALDVTIQAQILDLLEDLAKTTEMGILLVTHNLGIVAQMAENVHVMYAGRIVESGRAEDVITSPAHPYTQKLLRAVPRFSSVSDKLETIPGTVPRPGTFPPGCRFANRCALAVSECALLPETVEISPGHKVSCCRISNAAGEGEKK